MTTNTTVLIFAGQGGESTLEQWVTGAIRASGLDLIDWALAAPGVDRVIVVTADRSWAESLANLPIIVDIDPPGIPFAFGRRLAEVEQRFAVERVAYFGAGSAPLLGPAGLQAALDLLPADRPAVVTNNLHSSDWALYAPVRPALSVLTDLERDNGLAWALSHQVGFTSLSPPRSAASLFDLDTPADLAILKAIAADPAAQTPSRAPTSMIRPAKPDIGPHLAAALRSIPIRPDRVLTAAQVLATPGGQVLLAGRVAPTIWQAINAQCEVWVRVFSEERGMTASGRQRRGEVRSLLGDILDAVGPSRFWKLLAAMAQGIFFDTRVLMARRGWPLKTVRFATDLFRPDLIPDPYWRDFTAAARDCGIPVVLGGHSVVAGGLLAILEYLVPVGPSSS